MAGVSDIRDIMELSAPSDAPKPTKRAQQTATGPRLTGISREVYALMGDRAPPIPLGEQVTKYKSKPKYQQRDWKPRKWEQRAFVNGARKDGLVLRHWKLSNPVANGEVVPLSGRTANIGGTDAVAAQEETGGMLIKTSEDGQQVTTRYSDEFPMEKFNVKVPVPRYTEEQYNVHLKSETWTREETDYLMELCREYDLRWFVIADRWNFDPEEEKDKKDGADDTMALDVVQQQAQPKKPKWPPRTMEQLKSRYYVVAAAMLAISRPPADMLPSEYALWEKMQKFDAATETQRKKLAEALFSRSEDEAMEEKLLLAELKRIVDQEDQFLSERKDVYSRLEAVPSTRRDADVSLHSSAALSSLLQNLLAKEKRGKIIRAPEGPNASAPPPVPAQPERTQSWEKGSHPNQYTRRNTTTEDGEHHVPQKKGQSAVHIRKLTAAEEAKYGVTHHDRLTSGVSFRHEKVIKLTQAKSQAQTSKLQGALTELEIPPRLVMPTEKVCREFERLIANVNLLLDVRKLGEKVRSEVQVLEEARRIRLGLPKEPNNTDDVMNVDKKEDADGQKDDGSTAATTKDPQPATNGDSQNQVAADQESSELKSKVETTDKDEDKADKADEAEENEESKVDLDNEDEDDRDDNEEAEANASDADGDAEEADEEEDAEDEQQNNGEDVEDEDEEDESGLNNLNVDNDDDEDEDGGAQIDTDGESEIEGEDGEGEDEEEVDEDDAASDNDGEDEDEDEDEQGEEDEDEEEEPESAQPNEDEGPNGKEAGDEEQLPAPPSAATRLHKRSASVISEGSRAGSNRSGGGRKRSRK